MRVDAGDAEEQLVADRLADDGRAGAEDLGDRRRIGLRRCVSGEPGRIARAGPKAGDVVHVLDCRVESGERSVAAPGDRRRDVVRNEERAAGLVHRSRPDFRTTGAIARICGATRNKKARPAGRAFFDVVSSGQRSSFVQTIVGWIAQHFASHVRIGIGAPSVAAVRQLLLIDRRRSAGNGGVPAVPLRGLRRRRHRGERGRHRREDEKSHESLLISAYPRRSWEAVWCSQGERPAAGRERSFQRNVGKPRAKTDSECPSFEYADLT